MNTKEKVAESNRIEGIYRPPLDEEIAEFERFMALEEVDRYQMEHFVGIYQPGAILRSLPHLNVRVGSYIPPRGGPHISVGLDEILRDANSKELLFKEGPWHIHIRYEKLHPFTDGNGRSGRMLWYWMMRKEHLQELGFLHAFYYQTLRENQR